MLNTVSLALLPDGSGAPGYLQFPFSCFHKRNRPSEWGKPRASWLKTPLATKHLGSFQELVFKERPFKEQIPTAIRMVQDTSYRQKQ